jgi:hypothetical protein
MNRLFFIAVISLSVCSCGIFGRKHNKIEPEDRAICQAVDVSSAMEFLNNGNSANFEQQKNKFPIFSFISSEVENSFDGQNVIELKFAQVQFDFEDESVDPGDVGGFWARWKIILIPFDSEVVEEFRKINSELDKFFHLPKLVEKLRKNNSRVEIELSGPFLSDTDHCEWGDTDELGSQTLRYSDYGIYDWDFFPEVERVIGVLFEGDERIGDDFIAWLDISKNGGEIVVEEPQRYRIVFLSNSTISSRP